MSIRIMSLVWDAPFPTPVAKIIALKLADHANDEGANVYPSRPTVEDKTGCSRSAVKEWLGNYDACGLLVVDRTGRGGNPQDTTIRRFNLELLAGLIDGRVAFFEQAGGWSLACPLNPDDRKQQSRQKTRPPKNPVAKMGNRGRQKSKPRVLSDPKPSENHQEPFARDGALSEDQIFDLEGKGVKDRLRHHHTKDGLYNAYFEGVVFSRQNETVFAIAPDESVRRRLVADYEAHLKAACQAEWPEVKSVNIVSNHKAAGAAKKAAP